MRLVWALLALAGVVLVCGWRAWTPDRQAVPVQEPAASAAAQEVDAPPVLRPEQATIAAGRTVLDPRVDPAWDESPEGQVESRDWCGQAHRRLRELQNGKGPIPDLHDPDDGDPVLGNARRRVLERWARALEARGAPEDEVAAGLLRQMRVNRDRGFRSPPDPSEAKVWRRLLKLAGERRDAVAWLLPHCGFEQCVEAARWLVRADSANVHAWLAADRQLPEAELLEGLSQAQDVRPYEPTLLMRLLPFTTRTPGLRDKAELEEFEVIGWWESRWIFDPLAFTCEATPTLTPLSEPCLKAAERLWQLGSKADWLRTMALTMAKQVRDVDSPWPGRAEGRNRSAAEEMRWQEGRRRRFAVESCDASQSAGLDLRAQLAAGRVRTW